MNFVAIDFETATNKSNSACALGVAVVADGQIVDNTSWLIKPEPFEFLPWNVQIHGIHPEDVENAPTLSELWPEIYLYLQDNVLVAHSASFDIGVLRDTLELQGITPPPYKYACSLKVSRKAWPDLERHRLNLMAEHLHLTFNHHDAGDDAYASALIMIKAAQKLGVDSLDKLYKKLGHRFSTLQAKKKK